MIPERDKEKDYMYIKKVLSTVPKSCNRIHVELKKFDFRIDNMTLKKRLVHLNNQNEIRCITLKNGNQGYKK